MTITSISSVNSSDSNKILGNATVYTPDRTVVDLAIQRVRIRAHDGYGAYDKNNKELGVILLTNEKTDDYLGEASPTTPVYTTYVSKMWSEGEENNLCGVGTALMQIAIEDSYLNGYGFRLRLQSQGGSYGFYYHAIGMRPCAPVNDFIIRSELCASRIEGRRTGPAPNTTAGITLTAGGIMCLPEDARLRWRERIRVSPILFETRKQIASLPPIQPPPIPQEVSRVHEAIRLYTSPAASLYATIRDNATNDMSIKLEDERLTEWVTALNSAPDYPLFPEWPNNRLFKIIRSSDYPFRHKGSVGREWHKKISESELVIIYREPNNILQPAGACLAINQFISFRNPKDHPPKNDDCTVYDHNFSGFQIMLLPSKELPREYAIHAMDRLKRLSRLQCQNAFLSRVASTVQAIINPPVGPHDVATLIAHYRFERGECCC